MFLKTAKDKSQYRLIMLATTGLLATTVGYGLFSLAAVGSFFVLGSQWCSLRLHFVT